MSVMMEDEVKCWTAWRKSALVLEIIQGKTTVSEASRQFDLAPSEIEKWMEHAKAGMENALRAKPEDVREQYVRQLKDLQEAYGEAMPELRARKIAVPAGQGPELISSIRRGLKDDGLEVSFSKLCRWFGCRAGRCTTGRPRLHRRCGRSWRSRSSGLLRRSRRLATARRLGCWA